MDGLVIAVALLWVLVIILAIMVFALSRQIGILFERVAPMGALMTDAGPKVGEAVRRFELTTLDGIAGRHRRAGAQRSHARLLPVADLPGVQEAAADPEVRTPGRARAGSTSCSPATASVRAARGLRGAAPHWPTFPYVLSTELGMTLSRQPAALRRAASTSAGRRARQGPRQHARAARQPVQRARARRRLGAGLSSTASRGAIEEIGMIRRTCLDYHRPRSTETPQAPRDSAQRHRPAQRAGDASARLLVGGAVRCRCCRSTASAQAHGRGDGAPARERPTGDTDCDYWRYCALDGFLCSCCGGSVTSCPPGSRAVQGRRWVGTCHNPTDGKDYLVSYNDCCGKTTCGRCLCNTNDGDRPGYPHGRAQRHQLVHGQHAGLYHCTVSVIVGVGRRMRRAFRPHWSRWRSRRNARTPMTPLSITGCAAPAATGLMAWGRASVVFRRFRAFWGISFGSPKGGAISCSCRASPTPRCRMRRLRAC